MAHARETSVLALILGLWLAVNLATLERSPTLWGDEVMFAEPAVRWLAGQGFTVTSWPAPAGTPAVLNGPLHSALLVPWLWVWGVGPVAARSIGLLWAGLSAVLLWRLTIVHGAAASPGWRLAGVATFLCSFGVTWGYRSGRYDSLGMLLMVLLATLLAGRGRRGACHALAATGDGGVPGPRRTGTEAERHPGTPVVLPDSGLSAAVTAGTAALAALLPFAGLYLVAYAGLGALGLLLLGGRPARRRLLAPVLGLAFGGVSWAAMHWALGTWTMVAGFVRAERGPSLADRLLRVPQAFCADPSLWPLLAFLLGAVWLARSPRPASLGPRRTAASPAWIGLGAAVLVPAAMALAGKYTPYYGWMAFVPALGGVLCAVDRARGPSWTTACHHRCLARFGATALVLAAGVGLPLRLGACALEWRQRDAAPLERFVAAYLQPDDVAMTDSMAYYAALSRCREVMLPAATLFSRAGIPAQVTVLVGGDELVEFLGPLRGQGWAPVASYSPPAYSLPVRLGASRWYDVTVWRRP